MTNALTVEEVETDIKAYCDRIHDAEEKLAALPAGWEPDWKKRKKVKLKRSQLEGEIIHVRSLIRLAQQAIDDGVAKPAR